MADAVASIIAAPARFDLNDGGVTQAGECGGVISTGHFDSFTTRLEAIAAHGQRRPSGANPEMRGGTIAANDLRVPGFCVVEEAAALVDCHAVIQPQTPHQSQPQTQRTA